MLKNKRLIAISFLLLSLMLAACFINEAYSQFLIIDLYSSKNEYFLNEVILLFGNLTHLGQKVNDGLIAMQILNPSNETSTIRIVSTGAVSQENYPVRITQFYPSDNQGNPRSTPYNKGTFAHFTAYVQNNDIQSHNFYFAVNIYDKNGKPWALSFSGNGTIMPGENKVIISSYPIPFDFPSGTAVAYAVALTDQPKNNGVPHCPEAAATFQIATSTVTPIVTSSYQNGDFYFNFSMPINNKPGNYTVYASSTYKYVDAYKQLIFKIRVPDLNNDGTVDIYDLIIVSAAFGSTPDSPNWNPMADANGDNVVDIYDLILVSSHFGWED